MYLMLKENEMKKTYAYHKPSEKGLEKITKIRNVFSTLDEALYELCPNSRELSIALTHLETSAMWAVKSVVHNDTGSEVADCCKSEECTETECAEDDRQVKMFIKTDSINSDTPDRAA